MGKYTVNEGYVVLGENSEVVDWFGTLEEAEEYAEELEKSEVNKTTVSKIGVRK